MRLLLDTHALLWAVTGDKRLSRNAEAALADISTEVFISAASAWELTTKFRLGKLQGAAAFVQHFESTLRRLGFHGLPIDIGHAHKAGLLDGDHRDPFDRMLIAQALLEDLTLVSNEKLFDSFGVRRLW
jgi:PIN domain nuclease of toxin-antitoxin system